MAQFDKALAKVLKHEGGWANVSGDRGGQTYKGIARAFWPNWDGWDTLDKIPNKSHNQIIKNDCLELQVKEFYRVNFWEKLRCGELIHQRVAEFLFDFAVNSGISNAVMALQRCVMTSTDGIIGMQTIAAANKFNEGALMDCFIRSRIAFVNRIVKNNPSQSKFLRGWLSRINSFA